MTVDPDISTKLATVLQAVATAAEQAGRKPQDVRLVAVSKTVDAGTAKLAYAAGQRAFGENRAQELTAKSETLPPDIEWHFIGHLQKNKVRPVVKAASWIHSVDSVKLVERIERIAAEEGRKPVILLEVNISGETSKFGAETEAVRALAQRAAASEHVDFRGLMTMAPFDAAPTVLHHVFGGLRCLRDQLEKELDMRLPELSMGMSGDFQIAIEEGATLVRIGTAIFGSRSE